VETAALPVATAAEKATVTYSVGSSFARSRLSINSSMPAVEALPIRAPLLANAAARAEANLAVQKALKMLQMSSSSCTSGSLCRSLGSSSNNASPAETSTAT
jgi:hypothetical protein